MATTLMLEIVTPDKMVLKEEVEYVGAPGINGEFGVLPNHIPFLSALGIGGFTINSTTKVLRICSRRVCGSYSNKVTILAEVAERAGDIDLELLVALRREPSNGQ